MTAADRYRMGHSHGRRLAQHRPEVDHEQALRLEVQLVGTTNRYRRAWALGELRGYRTARHD